LLPTSVLQQFLNHGFTSVSGQRRKQARFLLHSGQKGGKIQLPHILRDGASLSNSTWVPEPAAPAQPLPQDKRQQMGSTRSRGIALPGWMFGLPQRSNYLLYNGHGMHWDGTADAEHKS